MQPMISWIQLSMKEKKGLLLPFYNIISAIPEEILWYRHIYVHIWFVKLTGVSVWTICLRWQLTWSGSDWTRLQHRLFHRVLTHLESTDKSCTASSGSLSLPNTKTIQVIYILGMVHNTVQIFMYVISFYYQNLW